MPSSVEIIEVGIQGPRGPKGNDAVVGYSQLVGDGTNRTLTITHGLGTEDVTIALREVSSNEHVLVEWTVVDENNVQLVFSPSMPAPTFDQYDLQVSG